MALRARAPRCSSSALLLLLLRPARPSQPGRQPPPHGPELRRRDRGAEPCRSQDHGHGPWPSYSSSSSPWDPSGLWVSPPCRRMVHRRPSLTTPVTLSPTPAVGKKDGGFAPLRAERRVKHGVPFPLPRVGNGEREREACLYVVALGLAGWDGLGITVYYRSKHLQAVRWCPRPGLEWDRWTTTTLLDRKHPHRAQETSQGMIRSSVTVSLTPST
jgi:hypothetical protein